MPDNSAAIAISELIFVFPIHQEEIAQNQVGRYLPLTAFEDVLAQIPFSQRMHHIEEGLIGCHFANPATTK
jgi:hypothetical protein